MISSHLAMIAFNAYRESVKGVSVNGTNIPEWKDLPEAIRKHWLVAAEAQRSAMLESLNLDEREILSLRHGASYARTFSAAGVPGASQFLLLAKFANLFGVR